MKKDKLIIILDDKWIYLKKYNLHLIVNCEKGYYIDISTPEIWTSKIMSKTIVRHIKRIKALGIDIPVERIIILTPQDFPKKQRIAIARRLKYGIPEVKLFCKEIYSKCNK